MLLRIHKHNFSLQFFTAFALIGVLQLPSSHSEEQDFVKKLRTDLLTGYQKSILPTNENSTLNIQLVTERIEVNEGASTFYLKLLVLMWWRDWRIRWDPRQYGNLTKLTFSASELWRPELTVYNDAAVDSVDRIHPVPMKVFWTGDIFWYPPAEFNTSCVHNVKKWPFDSNTCYVEIGSWVYLGLPMVNHPIITARLAYSPNPEWEITYMNASIRDNIFDCCPQYQSLAVRFDIKRKYAYPFALVCLPAMAIAITVLMSFWMEPKTPERTGLLLIGLLVNVYYLSFAAEIVPPNGDDVPCIIMYFRDSMGMIVIAILWTVCSRYIATSRRTSNVPLPNAVLQFLESWPSKILCIAPRPGKVVQPGFGMLTAIDSGLIGLESSVYNDWSWVAHLLDRIIFFLYTITYIIFLLAFL